MERERGFPDRTLPVPPVPMPPLVPGPRNDPAGGHSQSTPIVGGVVGIQVRVEHPGPSAAAATDGGEVALLDLSADLPSGEAEDRGDVLDGVARGRYDPQGDK